MKLDKRLKMAVMILLIILISIISFAGIYVQEKNSMVNCLKEYQLGMDLTGARIASVEINKGTKTIYYDKEGKVVETEAKDGKKEEIPINSQDSLTKENYLEAKKIVTKRLEDFGVSEYTIRQDEATGKMVVALPENAVTDTAMQYIYTTGKFTIENENNEVLLDNSNIKSVKVGYGTTEQGTSVNLSIEFKKDAKEKLKEITTTYVTSKDEEGKDNSKKVSMKLDETTLFSTSFSEEIQDGTLIISIGNVSTNNSEINASIQQARNLAILLNNGALPNAYTLEQNKYVKSDILTKDLQIAAIGIGIILIIAIVVLIIKYKKNGLLVGIANIGYIAVLMLLIRYTNVLLTISGLFGIVASIALNYISSMYLLKEIEHEENDKAYSKTVIGMLWVLVPAFITAITLCFKNWMSIYSFGEIIFWGILTIFVYNTILTRTLLVNKNK